MLLRLTRNEGELHIILFERDNGTETWMYADVFFVQHDLSHYAIEESLGYTTAFMGMINNGMDIKDFEDREKRKQMKITSEGGYAENMANLFLVKTMQGNFENFNGVFKEAFETVTTGLPAPVLSEDRIFAIRAYLGQLIGSWKFLPAGDTITLTFDLQ